MTSVGKRNFQIKTSTIKLKTCGLSYKETLDFKKLTGLIYPKTNLRITSKVFIKLFKTIFKQTDKRSLQ